MTSGANNFNNSENQLTIISLCPLLCLSPGLCFRLLPASRDIKVVPWDFCYEFVDHFDKVTRRWHSETNFLYRLLHLLVFCGLSPVETSSRPRRAPIFVVCDSLNFSGIKVEPWDLRCK